ncbi:MAG: PQQ-binding-like beta-propeller repeat protein [Chthoniobacteraceae bacterium]
MIAILFVLALAIVRFWPELERNLQGWLYVVIVGVAVVLVLFWFVFLSRLRWFVRLFGLAIVALAVWWLPKNLRTDGTFSSVGIPKLAWKWTQQRKPALDLVAITAPPPAVAANIPDVPQFFGPNRDGIVTGAKLARDWKTTPPKQLWRQPIGAGWSAFAVAGGRAFTHEQRGENEAVTCYDVLTGKLIWTHTNAAHFSQWQAGEGPHATPAVDRGLVFAYGATGILDCLDAVTGKRVWSREVLQENKLANLEWGTSSSPLVFDETVVVTGGNDRGPTVLAFIRATGEPLWRSGTDRASYSSPVLATLAGRRVVLSLNAASLTAHDLVSGEVVLNHPWSEERVPKGAQPVVLAGDRVFLSAGYGTGCVLLQIKPGTGKQLTAAQLWKNLRMKNQFNSVAVRDGFFYGLDDGLLACVATETGERKWKEGRYGSGQTLLVDDLVLIQTEPGPVVLAEAKPDAFQEIGRIPALSSKTWNHPTLAGRYLLVRNDQEAVCYELPVQEK